MEIPLKPRQLNAHTGRNKSASSNSGVNKHRGETDKKRLQAAQEQTRANQKVLILDGGRKRRWEWVNK